ncbi:MAG: hypothetical protein RLZ98_1568 [Pseudomonadota bacterium]|jgi:iron complex transport system substrate-binding protein
MLVALFNLYLLTLAPDGAFAETRPAAPTRVASLNVCTDQLLLALADPDQIVGLSRFSHDPDYSYYSDRARQHNRLRGTSEEILKLRPDLVLAGTFTRPELRQALRHFSIRVETFGPADTVEQGMIDISRAARLLGQEKRGNDLVAVVGASVAQAQVRAEQWREDGGDNISVLQVQRRAFVSGEKTLLGDLLAKVGVRNAATALDVQSVGRVSLEAILRLQPDILITEKTNGNFADQGEAMLGHPALASAVPMRKRLALPQQLIICSGPSLPAAMRRLTTGLDNILSGLDMR